MALPKPGLRFTERMVGKLTFYADQSEGDCEFTVTIQTDDIQKMLEIDENHTASIAGTVTYSKLSSEAMTISSGKNIIYFFTSLYSLPAS